MLTVDDILSLQFCTPYKDRQAIETYYSGRTECGLSDFLAMDIPAHDKLTVILRGNLISQEIQDSLKTQYISRMNKMRAPRLWREADNGDCAIAANCAQRYAVIAEGASSQLQRQAAIATESAWQLSMLMEALNG